MEVSGKGKLTTVEMDVEANAVPEAIRKLIGEHMPDFKSEKFSQKFEGDDLTALDPSGCSYELSGPSSKGKKLTVEIKADGTFVSIKREVAISEVPKVVMSALSAKAPKMKPNYAVEISEQDEVTAFLLTNRKGRTAYISADGKEVLLHKE